MLPNIIDDNTTEIFREIESKISKDLMKENWEQLLEIAPILSGSKEEERVIQFLKDKMESYGLSSEIFRYDAYISQPKYAKLEILEPQKLKIQCTPYRQVGSTGPEGICGEVIYIPPEDLGYRSCEGKIVLCEQKTSGDWMGLRDGFLLKLEKRGVMGLIVIEQDEYMPTVVHQRADFSVSGNPTIDNFKSIQKIPAIIHVSNNDGKKLKKLVRNEKVKAHIVSEVNTGWKTLPLLVSEIKGKTDPDKFLLVNSHIDTPPFSPGVTDNLSGNVAVLEISRLLSQEIEDLRRTVRFAFWTGHEVGRYAGSTWYNDAFWHDLRYNCVGSLNIDSPGAEGATIFRPVQITEVMDAAIDSIAKTSNQKVNEYRWATRAGDGSFWGTGIPHVSITSSRPEEKYDPHVNYSGGGWWWHTPYATRDCGDLDVLMMDLKAEINFILRMANTPILPYSFVKYANRLYEILKNYQSQADKIHDYFNLSSTIKLSEDFTELSKKLDRAIEQNVEENNIEKNKIINNCLIHVSRYINPVAHSNSDKTAQMTMESFGATPFPRIYPIIELADMTLKQSDEFKLLVTKLRRQRNYVNDGFYNANELIRKSLKKLEDCTS